jgi:DNA-binding NtrC family response regulator
MEALPLLRNAAGKETGFDLAVVCLPVEDWPPAEILEAIREASAEIPCVFMTENASLEEGLRLVRLGAYDYLPLDADLGPVLTELAAGRKPQSIAEEPWRRLLVGESLPMRTVTETIRLVAARRCTVLITGETGTGKEIAARAIHAASNRAQAPLVAVNCSALPDNLLEAELFGHVKGAFTGSVATRIGRFEHAHKGTIFLDEIAEMPLDLQTKLLRVLQEREIQRLGSSETIRVDVRVIAACNVDLEARVRQGRFREDLFYRLNVVPLMIPPLRRRPSDIPLLVLHFIDKVCRMEGIPVRRIASETLERLTRYPWPGNVRQLENAVEMAIALSGERTMLHLSDFALPSAVARMPAPETARKISLPDEGLDFEELVSSIERDLLEQALRKTGGNKKAAADLLRLKRTTLTAKLKALELPGGAIPAA